MGVVLGRNEMEELASRHLYLRTKDAAASSSTFLLFLLLTSGQDSCNLKYFQESENTISFTIQDIFLPLRVKNNQI